MKVFARNSMQGVWGAYLLQNCTHDQDFEVYVWDNFQAQSLVNKITPQDYGFILLDFALKPHERETVESLGEYNTAPFLHGYLFSSFGEKPQNLHCFVEEDSRSPILSMWEELENAGLISHNSEGVPFVQALNNYHHYELDEDETGISLMLLYDHYGKNILDSEGIFAGVTLDDILEDTRHTFGLSQLHDNLEEYVQGIASKATSDTIRQGTQYEFPLVVTHCERYQNEVAHQIIETLHNRGGYEDIAVMVGSATRGDDIYRVRTLGDIHAGKLAESLGDGGGKERTASVFLPSGNTLIYDTIVATIAELNPKDYQEI